jgi:hypothetical protein
LVPENATIRRSPELRRNQHKPPRNEIGRSWQSERERAAEGSARLASASRDPQSHRKSTVLQWQSIVRAEGGKLWRIEHAPPMPTSRCSAVAGGTASAFTASRDLPTLTHTHHPPTNKAATNCRLLLPLLLQLLASHQCQDRINHARPTPDPRLQTQIDRWVDEGPDRPPLTRRGLYRSK